MRHSALFLVSCLWALSCKGKTVGAPREASMGGSQSAAASGNAGTSTSPGIVGGRPNSGAGGRELTAGRQQIPDAGRDLGVGGKANPPAQGGASGLPDGTGGSSGDGGTSAGGAANGGASNGGASNGGTSNGGTSNGGTSNGGASNGGTSNGGTSNGGTTSVGAGGASAVGGATARTCTLGDFALNECVLH